MSEPESNKKGFNKIFLVIPVAAALIIILVLTSIDTDIKEHETFREIQVLDKDFYLDGFDIRLDLLLYNPNTQYDAKLDRIDVFVYAGNNNIAEVTLPKYITIPKNTEVNVPADITVRKTGVLTSIFDYIRDKDTSITIQGTVYYDSIFGTHKKQFFIEQDTQQKTLQISTNQQCNDAINNYLSILESMLVNTYSMRQFEEIAHSSGYDLDYMMFEIGEICDTDVDSGLINNPNVNTNTKNRMYDVFSRIAELENNLP